MKLCKPLSILGVTTLMLALNACSGGNSSSSSGSGGEATTTDTTTTNSTEIQNGSYSGEVTFANNGATQIEIKVDNNTDIVITSQAGAATGNASGSSFTATGVIEYVLGSLTCTGSSNYTGSSSGADLKGAVDITAANCIDSISNTQSTIDLNGTFTASLD